MRLLVVDDHEVVRRGVRSLLSDQEGWEVCGEAIDGQDAVDKARELKPDLIIMDVSIPRLNGLEATRQVRSILPNCEVLVLSQHENSEMARQALKAGARGYVVKGSISRDLISAISKASRGEYFFDPAILDQTQSSHADVQEILQRSATFEKALKESENRLRKLAEYQSAVMNNMAEGLYAVDGNGLLTSINPAAAAILGWTKDELLGKKMHDLTHYKHPDGSPFPANDCPGLQVVQKGIALREHEDTFIRKDGSFIPVVFSASPLKEDGKIAGVIVSFRDDTEQRRARAALQDSREQLLLSLESSKSAMFDWDVIQRRGNWNPQMTAIYGFEPKSDYITAEEWITLFHPEDTERLRQQAEQFWKEGDEFYFEFRTAPQNGNVKWVISTGRVVRDQNGKAIRMIGTHTDVTERKQAEAATGLLASIVASSDDAIVSKTLDGIITSWNRSAEKLFGYSSAEAMGQHITFIVPPDRHSEEYDILQRLSRGERIDHFETVRRRKDSSLVEVSLTISPVRDSLGKIVGASKIARDISAAKQAERVIGRGVRQQKALFRLADELNRAGSLGHVYSAALNAILDALQCNRASILLCDEAGTMRFQSWRGLSNEYRAAVDGHSAWKRDDPNPQPVLINDIDKADIAAALKTTVKKEGIAALAFIPLISNGTLIGKFMTYFNAPHHFSEHEIELSLTIARQLAFAIARQRNEEALRQSEMRLRTLSESLDAEVLRQTEQLRNLSYELLRTQDEERRHIARELHDSAGQTLAALGMSVAQLENDVAPKSADKVAEVQNLVQQLHREIRTMSYLLHPPLLDESGLSSALNWYAEGLSQRSGIVVTVNTSEDLGRLPGDMEMAIFRLVQECLTNIHRHSESKTASIRLVRTSVDIEVEVTDQGKGISSERLSEIRSGRSGVGIRGMQERLRRFGGRLNIESNGTGTRIIANVPIPKQNQSNEAESLRVAVG